MINKKLIILSLFLIVVLFLASSCTIPVEKEPIGRRGGDSVNKACLDYCGNGCAEVYDPGSEDWDECYQDCANRCHDENWFPESS